MRRSLSTPFDQNQSTLYSVGRLNQRLDKQDVEIGRLKAGADQQRVETERQNARIDELGQEMTEVGNTVHANVLEQNQATQTLIRKTNDLKASLRREPDNQLVLELYEKQVSNLRKSCEELFPLIAGYKRSSMPTTGCEIAHDGIHLVEPALHLLKSVAVKFVEVVGSAVQWAPIVGFAIKISELTIEHYFMHQAEHLVGSLSRYSPVEREAIYSYVTANVLYKLTPIRLTPDHFAKWHNLLLINSIFCLSELHKDKNEPIDVFAERWGKSLFSQLYKLVLSGVVMGTPRAYVTTSVATRDEPLLEIIVPEAELKVAYEIQKIFSEVPPQKKDKKEFEDLDLPILKRDFCEPWHRELYESVLKPYDGRVHGYSFVSWIRWYTAKDLETLTLYHARFNRAFKEMDKSLYSLRESRFYQANVKLINSCLYTNLVEMTLALGWHDLAKVLKSKLESAIGGVEGLRYYHGNKLPLERITQPSGNVMIKVNDPLEALPHFAVQELLARLRAAEAELAETKDALARAAELARDFERRANADAQRVAEALAAERPRAGGQKRDKILQRSSTPGASAAPSPVPANDIGRSSQIVFPNSRRSSMDEPAQASPRITA
ncbi:MAG TPA: hypothetical protein VNC84_03020 [Gammaproteobacteria bacterium]|jgi:hypothetical protein|nr:hypothetical protein [Gammaproteobacteria bacterium]